MWPRRTPAPQEMKVTRIFEEDSSKVVLRWEYKNITMTYTISLDWMQYENSALILTRPVHAVIDHEHLAHNMFAEARVPENEIDYAVLIRLLGDKCPASITIT